MSRRSAEGSAIRTTPWIPVSEPNLCGREREYVLDCIDSGWISSRGPYLARFEAAFAEFCGVPHAIAVANGTAALHLALVALGIGPGDEVIVPSLTYVATANVVHYTGATPVFVDCNPVSWNIDPVAVARAISPRTRAIIPVHLFGSPCDMDALQALAEAHGITLVEDAAEAFGSRHRGRSVGAIGKIGAFSLFGNKTITTGEGGMILTSDDEIAATLRQLNAQGASTTQPNYFERVGYNYRMTNLQAAVGLAQLENAEPLIEAKRSIARRYDALLGAVPGLTIGVESPECKHSYWMYCVVIDEAFGMSRDAVMAELRTHGVETRPFFPPCHLLPAFAGSTAHLPVTEDLSARGISLPSSTRLSATDQDHVVQSLLACRR